MRGHRWLLCCIGLLIVLASALLFMVNLSQPGVTQENFDRIQVGMTRGDVEAIFGGEANGEECSGKCVPNLWTNKIDSAQAIIHFDEEERVRDKHFWPGWPDERTPWQKVIDFLPWRERQVRRPSCMS